MAADRTLLDIDRMPLAGVERLKARRGLQTETVVFSRATR